MSQPANLRPLHRLNLLALVLLFLPALACKAFIPPTPTSSPETSDSIRVTYPTGIQTIRLDNGMIVAADIKGSYCLAFPVQWEVGAFHEDFVPTINKYCEINKGICSLFQQIYGKDNSLRIFAIDTASGHLTEDNMTVLHIGMFQEEGRLQSTMDELTAEYRNYIDSSGQLKVTDTLSGTTNYEVPFVILLTEPISTTEGALPAYSGTVLLKTDKAYVEMLYTTFDQSINIVDELNPILATFSTCHDQGDN